MKIDRMAVPARRLLTLREDHPVWSWPLNECFSGENCVAVAEAVLRLHPPPGVSDQKVADVVARAEAAGAVRVKVVARTPAPDVVQRIDVDPLKPKMSHRETVLEVAAEARSSDPTALRSLLEQVMDEEGV